MRKVQLEQGSQEWLTWRKGLLTATDAPILMGVSPYTTPYKGWQRKLGLIEEQKRSEAMERGIRDEPIARDIFCRRTDIEMEPCVIESDKYNFIGASLDGLSKCGRFILELKSNNAELHEEISKKKEIPDFHLYQVQHQLLSSDGQAEKGYYGSYNDGNLTIVEIFPDFAWYSVYLEKAREYWKRCVLFDPPPLTNRDYRDRSSHPKWNPLKEKYSALDREIKRLTEEKESCKKELIEICEDESSCGNGLKVLKKVNKGRVDYDAIMDQYKIDAEPFRKPSTTTWTVLTDTK